MQPNKLKNKQKLLSKCPRVRSQEMELYSSEPGQRAYTTYKERLSVLSDELNTFNPEQEGYRAKKVEFKTRMSVLWRSFEARSESDVVVESVHTPPATGWGI